MVTIGLVLNGAKASAARFINSIFKYVIRLNIINASKMCFYMDSF